MNPGTCPEGQAAGLSRRALLANMLAAGAGGVVLSASDDVFATAAFGAEPGGNVVVVLSQRGGADGLSLLVPHGDPSYYLLRPNTGIPKAQVIGLDAMFGLHPSLQPLHALWKSRQMAMVHAAGLPATNRSHFDAMAQLEQAAPGSSVRTGWINRMVGLQSAPNAIDGVQMGGFGMPSALRGSAPVLGLREMGQLGWPSFITANSFWLPRFQTAYKTLWDAYSGVGSAGARAAFSAQSRLTSASPTYSPANGAVYPSDSLATSLRNAAHLIKADVGARVVTIDHGDWDMHVNIGTLSSGLLKDHAAEFAKALSAFVTDLGTTMSRVTIVVLSEFGRRAAENGDRGADHGWGGVIWAIGAGVRGGKVYGRWPTLAPTALTNGDLAVTTDYRHVLAEVLTYRLNASASAILPNFRPVRLGMIGA
ncbi:MAG TPA: DUF1501 domain-containing protein [Aeromicrobium sp.]|nr:DUF1501 domain-containing protein [Aeromicrobium sp.]